MAKKPVKRPPRKTAQKKRSAPIHPKLASADAGNIQREFTSVVADFSATGDWLLGNPYKNNPQQHLYTVLGASKAEDIPIGHAFVDADLVRYVAASCVVHYLDAFSYLGASLRALMRGDTRVARHLAYYSELRSAISILAGRGVGIFESHPVFIRSGDIVVGRGRTHSTTWRYLNEWGADRSAISVLGSNIKAFNRTLGDWLAIFGVGSAVAVASDWVELWGVDLKDLDQDRFSRNELSYQPGFSSFNQRVSEQDVCGFLGEIWDGADPSISLFSELDKFLVREVVGLFRSRSEIEAALSGVGASQQVKAFFGGLVRDPGLLARASNKLPASDPSHYLSVLSRAYMLLRLACASQAELFSKARVTRNLTHGWVSQWGEAVGLWSAPPAPVTASVDLWDDVKLALEEVEDYVTSRGRVYFHDFVGSQVARLLTLSSVEKVGVWSLV